VRVCAQAEVSAAGAALLAWDYLDRAAQRPDLPRPVPAGRDIHPDPSTAVGYTALYRVYVQLYPALREAFGDLAAAGSGIE